MNNNLIAKATIHIDATSFEVWDGLTNPELIKQYFFGTEAYSNWKVGSPLSFKGEWEGKTYVDKGTILQSEPGKRLQYSYYSSLSGQEDLPENYATITYDLVPQDGGTTLHVIQDNVRSEEVKQHSEQNWMMVLGGLKELLEKK